MRAEPAAAGLAHLTPDSLGAHVRPFLQSQGATPRVVVIGNYGRGNLGDEAILAGILGEISDISEPSVLTRDPAGVQRVHAVRAVQSLSFEALRTVARSDVVSIGGGGIFGNGMTLLPRLLPLAAIVLQLMGKRVIFAAIGAYATAPWWVSALLRLVARRSPLITVRDTESAATFGAKAVIVRDPGVDLLAAPAADARAVLALAGVDPDVPLLGISVKPAMHVEYDRRQEQVAIDAVNWWLTTTTGQVVIVIMSARGDFGLGLAVSDRTLAERICAAAVSPDRISIVGPDLHPAVMKAVVGRMSVVVAHRLHAQIFAWSCGVPVVGMSYERKSDEFLRMIGAPRIDLAKPSADDDSKWLCACEAAIAARAPAGARGSGLPRADLATERP